jgi:gamma-glutamyltranspeptidase/glutathione hydrolase
MITEQDTGQLESVFGIMGGMMQPQAHLQVVRAMVEDGLDPQSALDMPRFMLQDGKPDGPLLIEESASQEVVDRLQSLGHAVTIISGPERSQFGLGQIISRCGESWWSGSDPRGDGHAAGF